MCITVRHRGRYAGLIKVKGGRGGEGGGIFG
jgi:hypothetical protein